MFSENGKISLRQLQCLIISDFAVVYILLLPYFFIGENPCGIILKFLLSFLTGAAVLYFCGLSAKRKIKSGGENTLKILCVFLLIKTFLVNGFFISLINSAQNLYLSGGKNYGLTVFALALFSFYICISGTETRGRLAELTTFFILLVIAVTVIASFFKRDVSQSEILFSPEGDFITDVIKIIPFLGGAEGLFFILPYVETHEKNIGKSLAVSYLILAAAVLLIIWGAICFFGEKLILTTRWQAAEFMKNMSVGFLPQRQNLMFTGLLLFGEAMYWAYSVFFSAECIRRVFSKLRYKTAVFFAALGILIFAFAAKNNFIFCTYWVVAVMNVLSFALSAAYILKYGGIKP